ncbi:MAG: lipoyl-dependent peroxiredoxin [Chloroflexota bacterium]|jgi:osmotically inducible protein OsmC|nr:lipoyl-dependent peroxiredoxin [Chloroflexota bacterium]
MAAVRSARAKWQGNLTEGSGSVSSLSSAQLSDLPISWSARTEDAAGLSGPEELLAAAHAACFSMAFSNTLFKAGFTAESIETTVEITGDKLEAGWTVISSHITVRCRVPGATDADVADAAEKAKDGCPISRALKGNVELSVDATLEQ